MLSIFLNFLLGKLPAFLISQESDSDFQIKSISHDKSLQLQIEEIFLAIVKLVLMVISIAESKTATLFMQEIQNTNKGHSPTVLPFY